MNITKLKTTMMSAACSALFLTTACTPPASSLKQLSDENFTCEQISDATVDSRLQNFPNSAVKGTLSADLQEVRQVLAQMPAEHLDDIIEQTSTGFEIIYSNDIDPKYRDPNDEYGRNNISNIANPLVRGITQGGGISNNNGPFIQNCKFSSIKEKKDISWALLHEIGHCIQPLQQNKFPLDFQNDSNDKVYDIFIDGGNRKSQLQQMDPPVREYAFQSKHELFAESYSNYYCSPEANQYLNTTFPLMHALMTAKFEAPRWETDPTGGTTEDPNTPGPLPSSSITLKMDGTSTGGAAQYTNFLEIGVPANINQVRICYGIEATCLVDQTSNKTASLVRSGDKNIFKTTETITVGKGSAITILGYDQANPSAVSMSRGVAFDL